MRKVYGYIRVSTAKQGEGVSLIAQKEAITKYASQYNLDIIEWFEEKETAAKQGRPLFNAMMKRLVAKKVDGVIIHKIDRGARNLKDWADLGNLIDQGIEVHFAHESLDLQARGGRLSADIQAVIAADYIRNLRQEAIKGIYGRLKQGIYPFAAPAGYLNVGKGKVKMIDPVQGPLVRRAFELYATKKYTLKTLAASMNALGLKNVIGTRVTFCSLSLMLNNPFYMGILAVKGKHFNGGHEPLISPTLFKQVQEVLQSKDNQKTKKHVFKFSRKIKCALCGFSLIAEIQRGHTYYRCHTVGCATKGVRETRLEKQLIDSFAPAQLFPEEISKLEDLLEEFGRNWIENHEKLIGALKLQIHQIDSKLTRLTDCYVEGGLDKETYEKRKQDLLISTKEKEQTQKRLDSGKEQLLRKARKFLELSNNLTASYQNGFLHNQRELIETVTSNLVVEGKKLIITMRSPFSEIADRFNFQSGEPERDTARRKEIKFVYDDTTLPPPIGKPLAGKLLKEFFAQLLMVIEEAED